MQTMTSRERFMRMFEHKEADRIPIIDDPWDATIERWQREGMPADVSYVDYFGLDKMARIFVTTHPSTNAGWWTTDEYKTVTSQWGVTQKTWKHAAHPTVSGFHHCRSRFLGTGQGTHPAHARPHPLGLPEAELCDLEKRRLLAPGRALVWLRRQPFLDCRHRTDPLCLER
ncbi:MAG: hypothetical protein IPK16_07850 [Anaerolineales bacterium]|nr:hypothetical protein [Anaerolineales bacterium]